MGLHAKDDDVGRADGGEIAGDLGLDREIAVRTLHAQSAFLHRPQMRAAGEEDDVGTGSGQPCTDVTADRAGAGNNGSHDAFCEYASATTRR